MNIMAEKNVMPKIIAIFVSVIIGVGFSAVENTLAMSESIAFLFRFIIFFFLIYYIF